MIVSDAISNLASKRFKTLEQDFNNVHKRKYSYNKFVYLNAKEKGIITCKEHGDFLQSANIHLSGKGCMLCGRLKTTAATRNTTEKFIQKSKVIHKDKYDYSEVKYEQVHSKVTIICPLHGKFLQEPFVHLRGSGCYNCASFSFGMDNPATLYYVSIDNGAAFKIGITNRSVKDRFGKEFDRIHIIKEIVYDRGIDAYNEEQRILLAYSKYKYSGPNLLTSGNTEMFSVDIFSL